MREETIVRRLLAIEGEEKRRQAGNALQNYNAGITAQSTTWLGGGNDAFAICPPQVHCIQNRGSGRKSTGDIRTLLPE